MTTRKFEWQKSSRIVAYINLPLSFFTVAYEIGFLMKTFLTPSGTFREEIKKDLIFNLIMSWLIVLPGFLQVILSFLLIRATKSDVDPGKALEWGKRWDVFDSILCICQYIPLICWFREGSWYFIIIIMIIIRSAFYSVVGKYVKELRND